MLRNLYFLITFKKRKPGKPSLDIPSLKLTAKAPENGWLEDDCFLPFGMAYFQRRTVSFREANRWCYSPMIYRISNLMVWRSKRNPPKNTVKRREGKAQDSANRINDFAWIHFFVGRSLKHRQKHRLLRRKPGRLHITPPKTKMSPRKGLFQ